jgi:hypothetical protein
MQGRGTGPFIPKPRAAAEHPMEVRGGFWSYAAIAKKSDRTEGQPVGEMNSPQGGGAVLAEKCLRLCRCSLSYRLPGVGDHPTRPGFMKGLMRTGKIRSQTKRKKCAIRSTAVMPI